MNDLPEADAHIEFSLERYENGVFVRTEWHGDSIVHLSLAVIKDEAVIHIHNNDMLTVGGHTLRILGYKSPPILVCERTDYEWAGHYFKD